MTERLRRRVKSDGNSEESFTESDVDAEDVNDAENSLEGTHEKGAVSKAADGSEYESAEGEDKATDKIYEESPSKDQESLSELVDEEGGEEGIADAEDVDGDFLSGDPPEEGDIEEGSDDEEYVEEERQQGDGEECSPVKAVIEKELDFDEDRRNPQYIPKKGIFYEHDDRNNEDVKEKEEEPARDRKKKLWLDEGRWGHDRFRLEEQFPKSKHELIETYGYDIRNEDGPPRARRRRRYGRGPTKYERNWEDVTAYSREKFRGSPRGMAKSRRDRGGPRGFRGAPRFRGRDRRDYNTEMPNDKEDENEHEEEKQPVETEIKDSAIIDNVIPVINSKEFPALPTKESIPEIETVIEQRPFFQKSSSETPESQSVRTLTFENSNLSGRNSLERDIPPRRGKTAPFSSHYAERGSRRPAPRGPRGSGRGEHNRRGRGNMRHISPRFLENKVNHLSADLENLALHQTVGVSNGVNSDEVRQLENNGIVSTVVNDSELPAMALKGAGDSVGRPKRYSSLRQRSLPETNSYPSTQQAVPTQHSPYYDTAGYQPALYAPTESVVPTPSTQSQSATSPPLINPSAYQTFMPTAPTPYTDYGLRLSVTTPPPRLFPQATVSAGQTILAPPPPPPCIPPSPSILNFAPPPPATGYHQFAYQQYAQPPPPPPPAPPNEIYQPGITYYYPQTQPTSIRPTVQKRPKAAIPILPPPERQSKGNENKEASQPSQTNSTDTVNGEVPSLRTESSSQSQPLPPVGVES